MFQPHLPIGPQVLRSLQRLPQRTDLHIPQFMILRAEITHLTQCTSGQEVLCLIPTRCRITRHTSPQLTISHTHTTSKTSFQTLLPKTTGLKT